MTTKHDRKLPQPVVEQSGTSGPVLFISYTGLTEPLGRTQVLAYIERLAGLGIRFEILSFEKEEGTGRIAETHERLARLGIGWSPLRYHKRPSLAATTFDIAHGIARGARIVRARGVRLMHARQHVPAAIALGIKRLTGVPFVFDVRGLLAEEFADAGHWREGELKYRLVKRTERRVLDSADHLVVLTEAFARELRTWPAVARRNTPLTVVPCCADLDRFAPDADARLRVRARLDLGDAFVLVYSGSLGSWYLADEMARFVAAARTQIPGLRFLALTPSDPAILHGALERARVPDDVAVALALPAGEVPEYLAAGDAGISFVMPSYSKMASSPTKIGEYLATGLPVVVNAGVGDAVEFAARPEASVLVESFDDDSLTQAAVRLRELARGGEATARAARALAREWFDLDAVGRSRYAGVYKSFGIGPGADAGPDELAAREGTAGR